MAETEMFTFGDVDLLYTLLKEFVWEILTIKLVIVIF